MHKNSKRILLKVIIFAFLGFSLPVKAIEANRFDPTTTMPECKLTGDKEKNMQPLAGYYLPRAYVQKLLKTHSHYAASNGDEFISVTKDDKGNGFTVSYWYNWHEGGGDDHFDNLTAFQKNLHSIQIIDKCHTNFHYYVKNDYNFITHVMFVGKWADDKGQLYEFTEDGRLIFPDHMMYYHLILDTVGQDSDYIAIARTKESLDNYKENTIIQIQVHDRHLLMYKTRAPAEDGSEGGLIAGIVVNPKKPMLRLHRIAS